MTAADECVRAVADRLVAAFGDLGGTFRRFLAAGGVHFDRAAIERWRTACGTAGWRGPEDRAMDALFEALLARSADVRDAALARAERDLAYAESGGSWHPYPAGTPWQVRS